MTAEDEAKQLDSVTDRVQEQELDASRANQALGALGGAAASAAPIEGSAIAVKKEDVAMIVAEMEISEDEATAALREAAAGGQNGTIVEGQQLVAAALRKLVTS